MRSARAGSGTLRSFLRHPIALFTEHVMRRGSLSPHRSLAGLGLLALVVPAAAYAPQAAGAKPVFADGQAQVVPAFEDPAGWIQHDLWVESEFDSDGSGEPDRIHVTVTRPGQTDSEGLKVAVIYETSPYYSGTGTTDKQYFWNPRQELGEFPPFRESQPEVVFQNKRPIISSSHVRTWVPRGFAVVHSSSPGTGLSQGCPTTGGENESLAPKAVIDWLNGRARGFTTVDGDEPVEAYWSTGKVGMTGTSYNGTLPVAAATTGVEGLEAIIPVAANTSYYHYYRSNGLIRHPGGYMGEDIDVLYEFIHSGYPEMRDYCNETVRDELLQGEFDRITGDYNDFWDGRNYLKKLDKYKAATLVSHGWNDWNVMPGHNVRLYEALKEKGVPAQLYFHQGGHGGPPPLAMMNRWFTRYLYGVENGVEEDARAWIVREEDNPGKPTPYDDYPHPEAAPVTLHVQAGGITQGLLTPDEGESQGTETLVDDVNLDGTSLAKAERSDHRLLYVTPELQEELHISGRPEITIEMSSSKPAVNLSVWLVSLPWTEGGRIYDNIITRGWADPQNHRSLTESEPLEPGESYTVTFTLQPDDQIIPPGARIGLMIFSSDRDFTLWPEPGTELTLDLDKTSLSLPVVGGEAAVRGALGLSGE